MPTHERHGKILGEHGLRRGGKGTNVGIRRVKEDLLSKAMKELGSCQVRSGTDDPCLRPAAVKIGGISFCESCARKQQEYFAIGELTDKPQNLHGDKHLVGLLGRMRQTEAGSNTVDDHQPDAA
jgi:hypothetical protein